LTSLAKFCKEGYASKWSLLLLLLVVWQYLIKGIFFGETFQNMLATIVLKEGIGKAQS
jgi:hypothetical protein